MDALLRAVEDGLARDREYHAKLARNLEISELKDSAPATVKRHRARVLDKMGFDSQPELIDMAMTDPVFMQLLQRSTEQAENPLA